MANHEFVQHFNAFLHQKGFVWGPSPEIYGGLAGFYTYAPLGKLLKNNVENTIRDIFHKNHFWEVECPSIMQKEVWKASGHLEGFTDPLIKCSKCNSNFRVDGLIEETIGTEIPIGEMSNPEILKLIEEKNIKCPNCKEQLEKKITKHNLMMKTTVGVDTEAYNRPETATTTYLPFPRYLTHFRERLPFGVFQIGKAFRNEISPRQHLMRMREFTQAEGQLFLFPDQKQDYEPYEKIKNKKLPLWPHKVWSHNKPLEEISVKDAIELGYFKNKAYAWLVHLSYELFTSMGIPAEKIRLRQHNPKEKAFYADDAWDLEIRLNSFGWMECCGIHDRTDYDLKQHAKHSGKKLEARDENNVIQVPHVLEIAFGTDRPTYALLDIFYEYKDKEEGKTKFNVPYKLAPVKVAIFPLMKKDNLPEKAEEIYQELSKQFQCKYDQSGSIGKRYLREDESGTPFCITIDYDTLEKGTVTIRDRNTAKQEIIKINNILKTVKEKLDEA
ncbi:glycine--tRNA ligase [Candidatus Woesearchaeota archaeon]|nr:glycine--tRNA ligase [Candidatus Woesearchaeota archaeon]